MIHPFYVIHIMRNEERPVYWKSHSLPATQSLGKATIYCGLTPWVGV